MSPSRIILLSLFLLLLLAARFWLYFNNLPAYKDGQTARFSSRLAEEPELNSGEQRFSLIDSYGNKIYIITTTNTLYHYGERLFIVGFFTKKHQRYYVNYPNIRMASLDQNYLSQIDVYIKSTSKKILNSTIPPNASALLLGIIFGGKQGITQDFLDKLRTTGVIHVIAASGMNVTMVAGFLVSLFGKILKRQFVLLLAIIGVGFYAFLAGFEPSIVRAAIMATISLSAVFLGRQYIGEFALLITAFIMLFYRPIDLFDVGFQLSFLSTWGIISIKPLLPLHDFFLADDIGTTLSAQIAALPVLLISFGQYGALSLIVNIFVLWTVPFLMILGALGIFSGFFFLPLGKLLVLLSWPFLIYFEKVVSFFAELDLVWKIQNLPWQSVACYYLMLLALVSFLKIRAKSAAILSRE